MFPEQSSTEVVEIQLFRRDPSPAEEAEAKRGNRDTMPRFASGSSGLRSWRNNRECNMETELIALTQKLLDAIATGDWATYQELCDPALTAFEPESRGQLVSGLPFHKFYFDLGGFGGRRQTTMVSP